MKFKAKPKLTPDRLRERLNKANGLNTSLRTFTMEVDCNPIIFGPDGGTGIFTTEETQQLSSMFNNNPYYKTDFHCDADFY